ncbi:gene transfer agent family protein [Salipiger thiooxidans]|uniref:gene transfer agent family protein n=1 Tax=Salipiger thiooxidans TaxID=282683 RepID=UPI001CD2C151|nr:gene transfer agent family protein [Salipiger thiooxidans]MCA0848339.1 gene transfer agent family protein [Salipiger thiooxidans]
MTKQIDGSSVTFRMTTRAMMAIEDHYGKGIVEVMQDLEDGFRIGDLVKIVSECAGNGAGVDMDAASELVDGLGVEGAGELLGEVAEAAFPEAKKGQGKNGKRAARSK